MKRIAILILVLGLSAAACAVPAKDLAKASSTGPALDSAAISRVYHMMSPVNSIFPLGQSARQEQPAYGANTLDRLAAGSGEGAAASHLVQYCSMGMLMPGGRLIPDISATVKEARSQAALIPSLVPDPIPALVVCALVGLLIVLVRRRKQPCPIECEMEKYTH